MYANFQCDIDERVSRDSSLVLNQEEGNMAARQRITPGFVLTCLGHKITWNEALMILLSCHIMEDTSCWLSFLHYCIYTVRVPIVYVVSDCFVVINIVHASPRFVRSVKSITTFLLDFPCLWSRIALFKCVHESCLIWITVFLGNTASLIREPWLSCDDQLSLCFPGWNFFFLSIATKKTPYFSTSIINL